jgi:hypothetical protein
MYRFYTTVHENEHWSVQDSVPDPDAWDRNWFLIRDKMYCNLINLIRLGLKAIFVPTTFSWKSCVKLMKCRIRSIWNVDPDPGKNISDPQLWFRHRYWGLILQYWTSGKDLHWLVFSIFLKTCLLMTCLLRNTNGGRWIINLDRRQRADHLDNYWLEILFFLIGEHADQHAHQVTSNSF